MSANGTSSVTYPSHQPQQLQLSQTNSTSPNQNRNPNHNHNHNHNHNYNYDGLDNDQYRNSDPLTRANTIANSHHGNNNSSIHQQHPHSHQAHQTSDAFPSGVPDSSMPASASAPSSTPIIGRFTEEWDASRRGSSIINGPTNYHSHSQSHSNGEAAMSSRPQSFVSTDGVGEDGLKRRNTLKKKASLSRSGSLRRSSSRRSMRAGSVRSLALRSNSDPDETHNVFHCPVPTSGNPTELLADRFQGWRKVLKDMIAYFREVHTFYESRSKALVKLGNAANNMSSPPGFLSTGGLDDALNVIRAYNKTMTLDTQKAREVEQDVITALNGLRGDLQLKIKEIKHLSGDFKNSVDKEMDNTRRIVKSLQDALGQNELDPALTVGKQDPYLIRLAVDRQVWRQLEEENYLHQAYLNLENSGRELESIVVGEIQKAYSAYAGIVKREADSAYSAVDDLRTGPIAMPKDHEWISFIKTQDQFVDPRIAIRSVEHIHYPGWDHPSCQEIRAGLLERKSKYLKSYTAGWYVLSPTHLHEFKSADKEQAPVMSLYLPEQKLGSHSAEGGSSNKFVLKGRQTGAMHRGHNWVFRAESYDTMMAWYEDIKLLTERTPEERSSIVRGHARSLSQSSRRSISTDGMVDEDDDEPYYANKAIDVTQQVPRSDSSARRLQSGGRFPSDLRVDAQLGSQSTPRTPSRLSSGTGAEAGAEAITGIGTGTEMEHQYGSGAGPAEAAAYTQEPGSAGIHLLPGQKEEEPHVAMAAYGSPRQDEAIAPYGVLEVDGTEAAQWSPVAAPAFTATLPVAIGPGDSSQSHDEHQEHGLKKMPDVVDLRRESRSSSTAGFGMGGENDHSGEAARPRAGERTNTISNLHVPGQYPKTGGALD